MVPRIQWSPSYPRPKSRIKVLKQVRLVNRERHLLSLSFVIGQINTEGEKVIPGLGAMDVTDIDERRGARG